MANLTERMVGAMKADVKTFQEIEADPNAMGQAVTVIVIAGVAALIGNIFRSSITGAFMALVDAAAGLLEGVLGWVTGRRRTGNAFSELVSWVLGPPDARRRGRE